MAFLRRSFLILFALVLGGGHIFAASASKEQRAYASAVAAFQNGMWNLAETEFLQFVEKFPDSTNASSAILMQAQAEFQQGQFTNAIALLHSRQTQAGNLADQFVYWSGEARFQNGNFLVAAAAFDSLARDFPESPLRLRAVVEAAAAQARLGDWQQIVASLQDTNGVFQRVATLDLGNEMVSRGELLLAQAKFALKDLRGASAILESLLNAQTLKPELAWQGAFLLCQVKLAAGEMNGALAAATNLQRIAGLQMDDKLRAESAALRAAVLEKMGRADEAIAAYRENLTTNAPADRQFEAVLKIAGLSVAQKQFGAAETALQKFVAQFPSSPSADIGLLTLGELRLKNYAGQPAATNDLALASANFYQLLNTFTNSPLAGKAYLDRGWCDWLAGKIPESLADFKMASEKLPPSEDLAVAKFKTGDALFKQKDFAGALKNYQAVLDDFGKFPAVARTLGDRALYQSLRAQMELNHWNGASNTLAQIVENYPSSDLADNSALLYGEGLAEARQPAIARALFQKSVEQFTNSDLLPQIQLAIAQTYEQEQNWPEAIAKYQGWLDDFPTNPLQPQAIYSLAQANFHAGDETNAFDLFTNFVAQFPTNELAPLAQWWVADDFFREGNYVDAERNYKSIFQNTNWQSSALVYPAQMMAGRAAMGRLGYSDAIGYFTGVAADTNCPPELSVQARFAWGSALMAMSSADTNNPLANFQTATNVFSQIAQAYSTNEWGALALGELGDCDLQLNNFDAATNAYARILDSPGADISARSRAQVGLGIALEKKAALADGPNQAALFEMALQNYAQVMDENEFNLEHSEPADLFWLKKAGLQAATLAENLGRWPTAVKLFQRLEIWFPQAKNSLEKKIAEAQPFLAPSKN
ncbi:MAG TPA: tetratricopeptide repeat protein [Verrucomicrobiae bacterium]